MAEEKERDLENLRAQINQIDKKIVSLLNERAKVVLEVGRVKRTNNLPSYDPQREKEILEKLKDYHKGPLPEDILREIYTTILYWMRNMGAD